MKTRRAWIVILHLLISLTAWHNQVRAQATGNNQKLVFCSEGFPESLAPSASFTATSIDAQSAIYETLVTYVRGETRLAPSLAEHWQVSKDGKEYVFFLQKGVKWHSNAYFQPTRAFNADDVIFTFERQWKPQHPYYHVTDSKHPYFNTVGFGALVQTITKVNNHTVKFTLKKPNVVFLSMLTLSFGNMQNQEYATAMLKRKTPEIIDTHPIGTGPFTLFKQEQGKEITFKAFKGYWRGKPKIDELVFSITPNASDRWHKIQTGACHVMPYPDVADLDAMRKHNEVTVLEQAGLNVGYLAYNTQKPPFNDVRVRLALNMAIDKQSILDQVYKEIGIRAINPIPPTMWSYNKEIQDAPFDPEGAKALLKEAGYENGFSADLWVMPVVRAYNPNPQLMGEMIKKDLGAIGVVATIKTPPWSEYTLRMSRGEHEMGLLGWTTGQGDPDAFLYNLLSCEAAQSDGPNAAKFCYEPYDALVNEAKTIFNPTLRIPLYEKAQQIFKAQAPWLPIAHSKQLVIVRNEVVNYRLSPFGRNLFYGVELKGHAN